MITSFFIAIILSMRSVFWVSSFYLSVNIVVSIVVLYQFTVTCIEHFASKVDAWGLSDGEKGSRLRLCFPVVDDVLEKIGLDLWKQLSSSKCSLRCICGIFLPSNRSTTTVQVMLRLHFTPVCVLLSVCSLHFTHSLHFTPCPFCTNRLSIWMRENVNRRLQSCLSPSRPFPLLESLFADWPMKSQMRLTNQTKVSFVWP